MPRPYTLFTGQWADLPFEEVARLASGWGYDGLEIAVSGDHLDAWRWDEPGYVESKLAILDKYNLKVWAISNHLKGQAVCDDPIDFRHQAIVGAKVWGDGDPEGVRATRRRGNETHRPPRPSPRRGHRRRVHRLLHLAIRRHVPARPRKSHRGRLPGLRRPLEPHPGRLRRTTGSASPTKSTPPRSPTTTGPPCGPWKRSGTGKRSG